MGVIQRRERFAYDPQLQAHARRNRDGYWRRDRRVRAAGGRLERRRRHGAVVADGEQALGARARISTKTRRPQRGGASRRSFFSSSFATATRWTSSGPSARRRVREEAQK